MASGKKAAHTTRGTRRGVYGRIMAKLLDNSQRRPVIGASTTLDSIVWESAAGEPPFDAVDIEAVAGM